MPALATTFLAGARDVRIHPDGGPGNTGGFKMVFIRYVNQLVMVFMSSSS
jgi:hypothetical protein